MQAKKAQQLPRVYGIGQPVSNQTDSNIWEVVMRSYGARMADEQGKKVVLGDYKREVWAFLEYFMEVWKAGVLPPGVTTWDNTMNNSTYQSGKAVFVWNAITISLWLQENNPDLLPKTAHYAFSAGPKGRVWDVGYASRSILKYTKYPDICKQFLLDSMDTQKMDRELSVSQWAPVLKSYLPFEVWNRTDYMKGLIELATKGRRWPIRRNYGLHHAGLRHGHGQPVPGRSGGGVRAVFAIAHRSGAGGHRTAAAAQRHRIGKGRR